MISASPVALDGCSLDSQEERTTSFMEPDGVVAAAVALNEGVVFLD